MGRDRKIGRRFRPLTVLGVRHVVVCFVQPPHLFFDALGHSLDCVGALATIKRLALVFLVLFNNEHMFLRPSPQKPWHDGGGWGETALASVRRANKNATLPRFLRALIAERLGSPIIAVKMQDACPTRIAEQQSQNNRNKPSQGRVHAGFAQFPTRCPAVN